MHINGTKVIDSQIERATDILEKAIKRELYSQRKKHDKCLKISLEKLFSHFKIAT